MEKEVIIGATVTLTKTGDSEKTYAAKTDSYGDFEFEKLPVANFNLKIANRKNARIIKVSTEEDVSLGDIPLTDD